MAQNDVMTIYMAQNDAMAIYVINNTLLNAIMHIRKFKVNKNIIHNRNYIQVSVQKSTLCSNDQFVKKFRT